MTLAHAHRSAHCVSRGFPDVLSLCRLTLTEVASSYADTGTDSVIPLPNVTGKILGKVIEYCKYHVEAEKKTGTGADEKASKSEEEVKTFDGDFVKVDQGTLFELILVRPRARLTSNSYFVLHGSGLLL